MKRSTLCVLVLLLLFTLGSKRHAQVISELGSQMGSGGAAAAGGGNDLTDDAVACWWLDASDTTADKCTTSETNNLTENGSPTYSGDATIPRYAIFDDANPDYFTAADTAALRVCGDAVGGGTEGSCSMGCFIKIAAAPTAGDPRMIHKGPVDETWFLMGYWFSNNEIRQYIGLTFEDTAFAQDPDDGGWHHIVSAWDDDTDDEIEIFIDGVLACDGACSTKTGVNLNATDTLYLGYSGSGSAWEGELGQCALFDYKLSDAEICDWCSTGLDGLDTDRNSSLCNSCTISP